MHRSRSRCRCLSTGFLLAVLVTASHPALADVPSPTTGSATFRERLYDGALVTYDGLVIRPVGAVRTGLGAVLFVPIGVLAAPGGLDNVRMALDIFVLGPFDDTFRRPLGDL